MELDFNRYQPQDKKRIATAIAKAIDSSFVSHPCRQTVDETRRRFGICARLFHEMCLEEGWLLGRFEDSIVQVLSRELDGQKFTGSAKKRSWCTNKRTDYYSKDDYDMTEQGILVPKGMG